MVYILADQTDIDSPSSISLVRTRPLAVRDKHQKLVEQDPSWKYIFTLHYRTKLFDFFAIPFCSTLSHVHVKYWKMSWALVKIFDQETGALIVNSNN